MSRHTPRSRTKADLLSIIEDLICIIDEIPAAERIRLGLYSLRAVDEGMDALAYARRSPVVVEAPPPVPENIPSDPLRKGE